MENIKLNMEKYASLARRMVAEGCVLLKNDRDALPLKKNDKLAVFGRIAFDYYKSGLGSGGLVNTRYVVGILDALKEEKDFTVNEKVLEIYENWMKEHPYDTGEGWGKVPWSQEEMPVSDELLAAAEGADAAIVIVGRTAGEDQDNKEEAGSYLLCDTEKELIRRVSEKFPRTVVLLNVGNIIDMKWVKECDPAAVLYVWQGGQEGGNGVVDVLTGRVNPCGKLADTIAADIADYPSSPYFGNPDKNFYKEDIYVGYRFFETFAKDKVLYPFGYGLSYTKFAVEGQDLKEKETSLQVKVSVKNIGDTAGREVVALYAGAPAGKLGKPAKVLIGFDKTGVLAPGETEELFFEIEKYTYASYDDENATGHKSCYVLEPGTYEIYAGADVRNAALIGTYEEKELRVVEQLEEACAPVESFSRMKNQGKAEPVMTENITARTMDWRERVRREMPADLAYTGDIGWKLADVYEGKVSIDTFVAQLSDEDLIHMFRGEGMSSPKVTLGTGAAFGGVTESLRNFGIPAACCTDGPSGLRFDVGTRAFSLPSGACFACSFDVKLAEELMQMTGRELRMNRVDALLGPGMNIHRNPLNGRNFEYFSEDPLLTGKIAAAEMRGLNVVGSTGVIKHYATNNQETRRRKVEAVVSERALREIYLKGFEIAVKEGDARAVMTTYAPLNGLWTAGSYDLNTTILRKEWGFEGIVMTDWWAEGNVEGEDSSMQCHAPMVMAQNDLYMVCEDCENDEQDDVAEKLADGTITRGQLQRNAKNILEFIMKSPAMLYEMNLISEEELLECRKIQEEDEQIGEMHFCKADEDGSIVIDTTQYSTKMGESLLFAVEFQQIGFFDLNLTVRTTTEELAQHPVTVYYDNIPKFIFSFRGTNGASVTETKDMGMVFGKNHYLRIYIGADGTQVEKITITLREELKSFPL